MISAHDAKTRARDHLLAEGSPWVVSRATLDKRFRVWVVSYMDPANPEQALIGGALVVTEDGEVHELGSLPGSLEELMIDLGAGLLPPDWGEHLSDEFQKPYWGELLRFVETERQTHEVFPPASETFAAFELTRYEDVRVVILGQDPYPNPGQAHGLAFSVPDGVPAPPSLKNIHKELHTDLGVEVPATGNLQGWAEQGVLLLNTALTVRAGSAADNAVHRSWQWQGQGWETFTDAVISAVSATQQRVVFILWGEDAKKKKPLISSPSHSVIAASHPSPLSANRGGFFGTRPFSRANEELSAAGRGEIDWARFRGSNR